MGKRNRRSRDKKRKTKRTDRAGKRASLAYRGDKYRTKELVKTLMKAEVGIYETFVMTDRKLTDRTVESAVEKLVLQMRRGSLPDFSDTSTVDAVEGEEENLVIWNIRRNWQQLFGTEPAPSHDSQIGVLRTILGSIDVWKSVNPKSRGYLRRLEGFLRGLGVSVQKCSLDGEPLEEPEDEELLCIGRDWCHHQDPEAAAAFKNLAEYMIRSGEADTVVEVCQQLIGESPSSRAFPELAALSVRAQQSMLDSMG